MNIKVKQCKIKEMIFVLMQRLTNTYIKAEQFIPVFEKSVFFKNNGLCFDLNSQLYKLQFFRHGTLKKPGG